MSDDFETVKGKHRLFVGDCVEMMRRLPDNYAHSLVTDPPYGISLLDNAWDTFDSPQAFQKWTEDWATEAYRVLKPGGHIVAFGSTRMYHRLTAGIEDAGFQIRDCVSWVTFNGFPKNKRLDIMLEQTRDDREHIRVVTGYLKQAMTECGRTNAELDELLGTSGMAGHYTTQASQPMCPSSEKWDAILEWLGIDPQDVPGDVEEARRFVEERVGTPGDAYMDREVTGQHSAVAPARAWQEKYARGAGASPQERRDIPSTDDGKSLLGWGTQLKPAVEPAVIARKPFQGTVTQNMLLHQTGALNIKATRFRNGDPAWLGGYSGSRTDDALGTEYGEGRYPANLYYCPKPSTAEREAGCYELEKTNGAVLSSTAQIRNQSGEHTNYKDRGNIHPSVKPVKIMRWLIRLVTAPGGIVIEPFCGSGTTMIAAEMEGVTCVAADANPRYVPIIKARMDGISVVRAIQSGKTMNDQSAQAMMRQGSLFE